MSDSDHRPFSLPQHLLWEYDLATFDYDKSYSIVIQRGNIAEWRTTQNYYGKDKMLGVARTSAQLSARDKQFTELYVNSSLNDPHQSRAYQAGNLPAITRLLRKL